MPKHGGADAAWYAKNMNIEQQDTAHKQPHMSRRRRFVIIVRWAVVAAWAVVVYFGSAMSAPSPIAYFIEFAVFSFLLANALWQHMELLTACALAVLVVCVFGLAGGVVSLVVPNHPFGFFDWLVGALGALAGGLVAQPALRVIDSFIPSNL